VALFNQLSGQLLRDLVGRRRLCLPFIVPPLSVGMTPEKR
jgi:hypothetical protein